MPWSQFLFSFKGSVTRRAYWLRFWLPLTLLTLAAFVLLPVGAFVNRVPADVARADPAAMLTPLAYLHLVLANLLAVMVGVKRCHDRDRSGWFLPIIGPWWLLIELGFLRGTQGANRFGPDPLQASG